jgi:hypothetical protein
MNWPVKPLGTAGGGPNLLSAWNIVLLFTPLTIAFAILCASAALVLES